MTPEEVREIVEGYLQSYDQSDIVSGKVSAGVTLANQYTDEQVSDKVSNSTFQSALGQLRSEYYDKNEIDEKLEGVTEGYATTDYVDDSITTAVTGLASSDEVEEKVATAVANLVSNEQFMDKLKSYFSLTTNNATTISENSDLDSYNSPGNYFCNSTSIVATLVNCPVITPFRLTVFTTSGQSSVVQAIFTRNNPIYYRFLATR